MRKATISNQMESNREKKKYERGISKRKVETKQKNQKIRTTNYTSYVILVYYIVYVCKCIHYTMLGDAKHKSNGVDIDNKYTSAYIVCYLYVAQVKSKNKNQ